MGLYDAILAAACELEGIDEADDEAVRTYLAGLQPYVRKLRDDYSNDRVSVSYQQRVCEAYLFAYYPAHVLASYQVLRQSIGAFDFGSELRVTVVGAGPAPEVAALQRLFHFHLPNVTNVAVQLFDRDSRDWKRVRKAVANGISRSTEYQHADLYQRSESLTLGGAQSIEIYEEGFRSTELFIMQNVLNEVPEQVWDVFKVQLATLIGWLPPNAIVVISDFGMHVTSYTRLLDLEHVLYPKCKPIRSVRDGALTMPLDSINASMPAILRDNLFTRASGLMSKKKVTCTFLLGTRRPYVRVPR